MRERSWRGGGGRTGFCEGASGGGGRAGFCEGASGPALR